MTLNLRPGLRTILFSAKRFSPLSLPNLALWLDATVGLTLSTTPYAGTGTVTQVGTALTGVGTAFTGEVKVGDALSGTLISGNVVSIASPTALTLDASNSGAGAAFTITPVAGVSDRVTTWADQSGNGRNASQATAALKPSKTPAAQNGLPALLFDLSDGLSITMSLIAGSLSFWAVVNVPTAVVNGHYLIDIETGRLTFAVRNGVDNAKIGWQTGAGWVDIANTTTGWQILVWVMTDGGNGQLFRNGVSLGTSAYTGVAVGGQVAIGSRYNVNSTNGLRSTLGECGMVAGALSAGNRALLTSFLQSKWGL